MASLFDLFVQIKGDNSSYKKTIRESGADTEKFGSIVDTVSGAAGEAWSRLGAKFAAAGIGATILNAGREFQNAGAKISRMTGDTGAALESLNGSLRSLYANSARSADEIGAGLSKLHIETKLQGEALESLTAANLRFAKVTGSDVASAVEETQTLFKQWGVSSSDQADKLDVLYSVMTQTGIGLGSLSGQLASIGPITRAFGMTFNESAAMVGAFEEAGIAATDVTRGLQMAFAKWAAAGKDPKQALFDLIEKMKSARTEADAVALATEAGFVRGVGVKMVDAVRRGAFELREFVKAAEESKGKVKEVADSSATLSDGLSKVWHNVNLTAGSIGGPLVDALTAAIGKVLELNREFAEKEKEWFSPGWSKLTEWGGVINNALNPWASGNYLNNLSRPKAEPALPVGPTSEIPDFSSWDPSKQGPMGYSKKKLDDIKESAEGVLSVFQKLDLDLFTDRAQNSIKVLKEWYKSLLGLSDPLETVAADTGHLAMEFWNLQPVMAKTVEMDFTALQVGVFKTDALMERLGKTSTHALRAAYDAAVGIHEQVTALYGRGQATEADVNNAAKAVDEAYVKLDNNIKGIEPSTKKAAESVGELARQTERAFRDISVAFADLIVDGGKFGDAMAKVGKSIVKVLVEDIAQYAFGKLLLAIGKSSASLTALGTKLAGVFGGGAGAASSVATGAGGAVSGGSGAASGVAGAVSGGLAGTLTAAFSGINALFSGLSFFQGRRQEQDIARIEVTSRGIYNAFWNPNGLVDMAVRSYQQLEGIRSILSGGMELAGAGGESITIDMSHATFNGVSAATASNIGQTTATAIVRELRLRKGR